jgi:hypothetical protein
LHFAHLLLAASADAQVAAPPTPPPPPNVNEPVRVPTIRCTLVCKRDLQECGRLGDCPPDNCTSVCAGPNPRPSAAPR